MSSKSTWIIAGTLYAIETGFLVKKWYFDEEMTTKMFAKKLGGLTLTTVGSVSAGIASGSFAGFACGALTGSAAGSWIPIIGNIVGGIIGGFIAGYAINKSYN